MIRSGDYFLAGKTGGVIGAVVPWRGRPAGVAPGVDFGENGEGYLRFSYANSLARIAEGLDRIERYLEER